MKCGSSLVLVGARGSGKSTVGAILAERLSLPLVETDHLVQNMLLQPIKQLFEEGREDEFRAAECRVIAALDPTAHQVVSTGGGVVVAPNNRVLLWQLGVVIWLVASAATLGQRIAGSDRPSLTGGDPSTEVAGVLEARRCLYREVSDQEVETEGRSPRGISDELQRIWPLLRDRHIR